MTLAGRRYIVCRNHDQMRKDAAARAAIPAALEGELKGDKARVGNKGYRGFLMSPTTAISPSTRPSGGGRQVRRRLRAQDQCPAVAARSDARLQAAMDGGYRPGMATLEVLLLGRGERFRSLAGSAANAAGSLGLFSRPRPSRDPPEPVWRAGAGASAAARQSALLDPGV